jgi:hypothetical protein
MESCTTRLTARPAFPSSDHRIMLVPFIGPDGSCLGIVNTCNEETDQVLANRRLAAMQTITDLTVHSRTQDEFLEGLNDAVSMSETARDIPYMVSRYSSAC